MPSEPEPEPTTRLLAPELKSYLCVADADDATGVDADFFRTVWSKCHIIAVVIILNETDRGGRYR